MILEKNKKVNTLAEVLANFGFTTTANEAERIAKEIINTEKKVRESFEKKTKANTMYSFIRKETEERKTEETNEINKEEVKEPPLVGSPYPPQQNTQNTTEKIDISEVFKV